MKHIHKLLIAILLLSVLFAFVPANPVSAQSNENDDGQVVIGGIYHLNSGETLQGDLILIGGSATLDPDSVVTGSVLIAGGTLEANGTIQGDVVTFGGIFTLNTDALVNGDLISFGGINNIDKDARVDGNIVNNEGNFANFNWESFDFQFGGFNLNELDFGENQPGDFTPNSQAFAAPRFDMLKAIGKFFWSIARAIGLAILAVVASLFMEKPLDRTTKTLFNHPALSFGIGLLTIIIFPILMIFLMITIILIPISLIGLIGLGLAVLFGWFALSLMLGERLAQLFHTQWAPALSTGIGSLVLSLISGIAGIVPCIGWLFPFFFASAGLGAVILSRLGSRIYTGDRKPTSASTPAQIIQPEKHADYSLPPVSEAEEAESSTADILPPLDIDAAESQETGHTEDE